jgi:hypothetical protein
LREIRFDVRRERRRELRSVQKQEAILGRIGGTGAPGGGLAISVCTDSQASGAKAAI